MPVELVFVPLIMVLGFIFFFFLLKGRKWLPLRIASFMLLFGAIGGLISFFVNLKIGIGIGVIGVLCFFCGVFLKLLDFLGGTTPRKRWEDDE
jgi:hypothetical protein